MPSPFEFPSSTANVGLPLLFAGQAQKEFFVNQAFAVIDALLHRGVVSAAPIPPASSQEGDAYQVIAPASGEWAGEEGSIAVRIGGAWHFVAPREGMVIYDRDAGRSLVFREGWEVAETIAILGGGTVVDTEARSAIEQIIIEMRRFGILS